RHAVADRVRLARGADEGAGDDLVPVADLVRQGQRRTALGTAEEVEGPAFHTTVLRLAGSRRRPRLAKRAQPRRRRNSSTPRKKLENSTGPPSASAATAGMSRRNSTTGSSPGRPPQLTRAHTELASPTNTSRHPTTTPTSRFSTRVSRRSRGSSGSRPSLAAN